MRTTWSVTVAWSNGSSTGGQAYGTRKDAVDMANTWIDAERDTTLDPRRPVAAIIGHTSGDNAQVIILNGYARYGDNGRAR